MYETTLTLFGTLSFGLAEVGLIAACGVSAGLLARHRRRERLAASDRVFAAYRKAMAEAGGAAV